MQIIIIIIISRKLRKIDGKFGDGLLFEGAWGLRRHCFSKIGKLWNTKTAEIRM